MLQSLSIKNYAIIDSLEIDFRKGFSVITGETGSGKSIILGALQLLMGQRAGSKVISNTANKCVIEGSFEIENYNLSPFFSDYDLDYEPLQTIVRREVHSNGKSRAFINDNPVKLDQLKEFADYIIDIHSQHQSLLLNNSNYQLQLIDSLAQVNVKTHKNLIGKYQSDFKELKRLETELEQILNIGDESKNQLDYLLFLHSELEEASLVSGEKETLEATLKISENRDEVVNTLKKVAFIIDHNHQQSPVNTQLHELFLDLQKIACIDQNYEQFTERLNSITIELSDLSKESDLLLSKIEQDNFRYMIQSRVDGAIISPSHPRADLKVLEGLSFDIYKPELICVEIHAKEIKKSDIYNFLVDKNYELLWSGVFSHIFKRL